ncbi:hypothetical protein DPMN_135424 [Dreissena polymorpha]|uniref:Uncharacterized protein n=1 Tax=Dreissena polymorpha TaxID=45954 RepID=A0A9D4FZ54_DREPO|nr:hypothetical protein DPMN_135424 [Dreissena polymorpha]
MHICTSAWYDEVHAPMTMDALLLELNDICSTLMIVGSDSRFCFNKEVAFLSFALLPTPPYSLVQPSHTDLSLSSTRSCSNSLLITFSLVVLI